MTSRVDSWLYYLGTGNKEVWTTLFLDVETRTYKPASTNKGIFKRQNAETRNSIVESIVWGMEKSVEEGKDRGQRIG